MLAYTITAALLLAAQPIVSASSSSSSPRGNGVPHRRRTIINTKRGEPGKQQQQQQISETRNLNLVAPLNDICTNAVNIPATTSRPHSFYASYTTVGATSDFDTESCGAASETNGVWYKYTPGANETLTATVVDSTNNADDAESYANYATASGLGIRVYTGEDCTTLTCHSEFDPSSISFVGEANVEYKFLISSAASSSSGAWFSFALGIEEESSPTISPSKSVGGMDVPASTVPAPISSTGAPKEYSLYRDDHNSATDDDVEAAGEIMDSYDMMSYSTKSSKYTSSTSKSKSSSSSSDGIEDGEDEDDCDESMSMSIMSKSSKTSAKAFKKSKSPKRGYDSSSMSHATSTTTTKRSSSTSSSSSSKDASASSMSTSTKSGKYNSSMSMMSVSKSSKTSSSKCSKVLGKTDKSKSSKMGKNSKDYDEDGNGILGLNALNRLNTLSNDGVVVGSKFNNVSVMLLGLIIGGVGVYLS